MRPAAEPGLRPRLVAAARRRAQARRTVRRSPPRFLRYLSLLGPGLIAASAGNDAGAIATHSSAGATYGYNLLWTMVAISLPLIIVQEMASRMGVVTGKGLTDLIRERFGVRWTTFAMITLLVANGGTVVSEFAGIAAAFELFGISKYLALPVMGVVIWWLVVRGSYRRVERVFLGMSFVFFAYIIAAILARPDWGAVAASIVRPSIEINQSYLLIVIAIIGTTITPYMQLFQQSAVVDKGIAIEHYRDEQIDVAAGSIFANIVVMFIQIATAATLFVQGVQVESASDAALALQPVAGPFATWLFAFGLLGASLLAAGVLPLATAFAICEAFGFERGMSRDWDEAPVFYTLFTLLIIAGVLVTLIPGINLIALLLAVQVANGLLLPVILVFISILAADRDILGRYANGPVMKAAAWSITVVVSVLAILLILVTAVLPLVGINLG